KSSAVDPVTIVDTLAEDFIANRLQELRPEDGLIGEEGTGTPSLSGVTWIVDPIDGTVNFVYGLPQYAVSIAAAIDGEVVAGAVINVETGVLYSAARGQGAYKYLPDNDEIVALRVNDIDDITQCLVATGFGYSTTRRAQQAQVLTWCCRWSGISDAWAAPPWICAIWRMGRWTSTTTTDSAAGTTERGSSSRRRPVHGSMHPACPFPASQVRFCMPRHTLSSMLSPTSLTRLVPSHPWGSDPAR